jgi:TonB family protein
MGLHNTEPSILSDDADLLETNILLWRDLTDNEFESHFRKRYFGDELISRQQAIERLTKKCEGLRQPATVCVALDSISTQVSSKTAGSESAFDLHLTLLPPRRLPWRWLLLSVLSHGLLIWALLSVRLPQRRNLLIDFDSEKITYYKVLEALPNVTPVKREVELHDSLPQSKAGDAEFRASQEVRIHPQAPTWTETVVEQPQLPLVSNLPKLQLPNILMQTSKLDPGREPLVVSPEVISHLAIQVQQPQSLQNLPLNPAPVLGRPTVPLPQLAAPAEPSAATLQLDQVAANVGNLQETTPLPFAAPPVEELRVSFQVEQIPVARGADLLVYSASPAIPKGEIAVPKVSSTGRLSASPAQTSQPSLPAGTAEVSQAEVVMPSISISNRKPPDVAGPRAAVVQVPLPKAPVEPKLPNEGKPRSLLDSLPSRLPSRPLAANASANVPAESPLREYENRGGPVFTAAINAPNFTSKRGSWIFRFAELWQVETAAAFNDVPVRTAQPPLTPPSATVKIDPRYPPEVIRERLEGIVILYAILRKDGNIDGESIRVIRKLDARLDLSAREALLNWKFKPSLKNGVAVDIQMEVSIPFYLRSEGL